MSGPPPPTPDGKTGPPIGPGGPANADSELSADVHAAPRGLGDLSDNERDLIRQGERTVDNLKRLFAVVFAISFTVLGTGVIDKLSQLSIGIPRLSIWLLNGEMTVVFVVTAGVFYHQSTKFLDIRYAKHPLSQAHPWGFAWDYVTLVLTAVPFFLMAHAARPVITHTVGYLWFFVSYVFLLGQGLILLLISTVRHSNIVRTRIFKETIVAEEILREGLLRTYWLVMNSLILFILVGSFYMLSQGASCPVSAPDRELPTFLYFFGLVALLRDYLDYRYAWRFLYPVAAEVAESFDKWPITLIVNRGRLGCWVAFSCVIIALIGLLLFDLRFWNVSYWASACAVSRG